MIEVVLGFYFLVSLTFQLKTHLFIFTQVLAPLSVGPVDDLNQRLRAKKLFSLLTEICGQERTHFAR